MCIDTSNNVGVSKILHIIYYQYSSSEKGSKKGSTVCFSMADYRAMLHPSAHDMGIHIELKA